MKTTEKTVKGTGRLKTQLANIYRKREFGVFMVVIIFMIIVGLRNPTFFTRDSVTRAEFPILVGRPLEKSLPLTISIPMVFMKSSFTSL